MCDIITITTTKIPLWKTFELLNIMSTKCTSIFSSITFTFFLFKLLKIDRFIGITSETKNTSMNNLQVEENILESAV